MKDDNFGDYAVSVIIVLATLIAAAGCSLIIAYLKVHS